MGVIQATLGVSVLLMSLLSKTYSQSSERKAYVIKGCQVNDKIKPLQIGDKLPNIKLGHVINYSKDELSLSDLEDKYILFDFWATWCLPCVNSIPKIEELKRKYSNELAILPVTYQSEKEIGSFIKNLKDLKGINWTTITSDTLLGKLFIYSTLPHYVWIDKKKTVVGITSGDEVNDQNISLFIKGGKLELSIKAELRRKSVDYSKSLLNILNNYTLNEKDMKEYRVFYQHLSELPDSRRIYEPYRITLINQPIVSLFAAAFSDGKPEKRISGIRTKILTNDSSRFLQTHKDRNEKFPEWYNKNTYSYEIVVQPKDSLLMYKIMQEDFKRIFPVTVKIETETTKSFVLKKNGNDNQQFVTIGGEPVIDQNALKLKYKNVPITRFIYFLQTLYQYKKIDVINETGYSGNIDLEINADLKDLKSFNRELNKWGLELSEEVRSVEVLVIKDNNFK